MLKLKNNPLALFPTELPLTGHTRVPAAKVVLEQARPLEGISEVLAKLFQLKNDPLSPIPTELTLTRHTRVLAAKVGLEQARPMEGIS